MPLSPVNSWVSNDAEVTDKTTWVFCHRETSSFLSAFLFIGKNGWKFPIYLACLELRCDSPETKTHRQYKNRYNHHLSFHRNSTYVKSLDLRGHDNPRSCSTTI